MLVFGEVLLRVHLSIVRPMKAVIAFCLVVGIFFLLLRSCFHFSYEETPYSGVFIQEVAPNSYELTFRYQARISGDMHSPSLPFSSTTFDRAEWFYVQSRTGEVAAADVVFTQYRDCKDSLYWQKEMRGVIKFSTDKVTFLLEMPRYEGSSNTVQRHVAWEHNGEYALLDSTPAPLETKDSDYRPTSCDDHTSIIRETYAVIGRQYHYPPKVESDNPASRR